LAKSREGVFLNAPVIDERYAKLLPGKLSKENWCQLFEERKALGAVVMQEILLEKLGVSPSYTEVKKAIAVKIGVPFESLANVDTTMRNGWKIFDTAFELQYANKRPTSSIREF